MKHYQVLHTFGLEGKHFVPANAQELVAYSDEQLQPYVEGKCLVITEIPDEVQVAVEVVQEVPEPAVRRGKVQHNEE